MGSITEIRSRTEIQRAAVPISLLTRLLHSPAEAGPPRWAAGGIPRDRWISRRDWICIGDRAECTNRGHTGISVLFAIREGSATYWECFMTIEGKTVLVTGANRGIGRALVEEALSRGARRVYAGTRHPFVHPDQRATPLMLDVTNTAQIEAAAEAIESLDILINNAGVAFYDDLSDRSVLEQHFAVNLFGTF
jgi:short chain dehydrogenase